MGRTVVKGARSMNNKQIDRLVTIVRDDVFDFEYAEDSLYVVEAVIEELNLLAESLRFDVKREAKRDGEVTNDA